AWPQSPAMRDTARGARRTGFGAGLRRGMAVVLAVAALACWLGKSPVSPGARSTAAPPVDARGAAGVALTEQSPTTRPFGSEPVTGPSGAAYYARAIETVRTGQRVLDRNTELAGVELPDAQVDPATRVNIRQRMPKPTGDILEITLLRPVEWLAEHLAQTTALDGEYPQALAEASGTNSARVVTGLTSVMPTVDPPEPSPGMIEPITADNSTASPWIFLTLPELEAVGPAEIVGVGPCPELETGEGRLVTGTFSHQSGEVFDITVDGLTEPIGCTRAHPFWSEDRHDFIPARDLRLGETLRTESGTLRQITRITPRRGPPVPVFNLEVDAEHVYYVSVDGVLVHNACPGNFPNDVSSPNAAARMKSQGEYIDPLTNKVMRTTETLAADHIFPKSLIKELPGFDKLTLAEQSAVLNNLENFRGLPQSLNASKGSRIDWSKYRGQPLDTQYAKELADLQQIMKTELMTQIDLILKGRQ
ncbi:MAG: polymorphic toxin-type HINT domain-containing protein, partial [Planctomycetaceae bacterium]